MDNKMELLLVEDDPADCREMLEAIDDNADDFYLIGVTNSADKAFDYIMEYHPDAVILDLELSLGSGNGLDVLTRLKAENLSRPPFILVTTNSVSTLTHKASRDFGADFIMTKSQQGYSAKYVLSFLKAMKSTICNRKAKDATPLPQRSPEQLEKAMQRKIMNELNLVGINPKSIGYRYLTEAIEILVKEENDRPICHILAQKYKKSAPSIERAMQNAINRAWESEDPALLLEHYTARIRSLRGMPTLTEFIHYYANKFKNEY
ncbi:MAG: response regulator [Clostridia bacterium]|nr:response regulator [Clostridia bacterium]